MTRQRAISHLNDMLMWGIVQADEYNALKMAIKALEQAPVVAENTTVEQFGNSEELKEPCEDCISRKDVFDLVQSLTRWCVRSENGKFNNVGLLYDDVMFGVNRLPSVNPQKPKTNWIPCSVRTPKTDDLYYVTEKIDDNIACTTEEWRDGRWVNLAEWEKVIAWMPIPDAYEESEE